MPELCLLPPQRGVFFEEQQHKYFYRSQALGDIEVPSSSHIIALAGGKDFDHDRWRNSLMRKGLSEKGANYFMERVRDIRAAIGTGFHEYADMSLCEQEIIEVGGEVEVIWRLWLEKVLPRIGKVYIIEEPMIHPGGCYGFTPDLVAEVDGILSLCDWKTNQAQHFAERYERLCQYAPDDEPLRVICDQLAKADKEAGKVREVTARVRGGWQMQQGSYAFGLEAVHGLKVQRGINFMLSVDEVREHSWNLPDLEQGWTQFASGLLLHHQRAVLSGGHPIFQSALNAMQPLMRGA
jgi:hypothetical protein